MRTAQSAALAMLLPMIAFSSAALACMNCSGEDAHDEEVVRIAPQADYVGQAGHCRVSIAVKKIVVRSGKEWVHLAITVENLGKKDLTLYNPFFHPVHDAICLDSHTAMLMLFDDKGQACWDVLDPRPGISRIRGVARSWVLIRANKSWTGKYIISRSPGSRVRYVQAIFLDRFVSSHPFGGPPWPIDGDYSDLRTMAKVRTFIDANDPRVKAWREAYPGKKLFRSNTVRIDQGGPIRMAGDDMAAERCR